MPDEYMLSAWGCVRRIVDACTYAEFDSSMYGDMTHAYDMCVCRLISMYLCTYSARAVWYVASKVRVHVHAADDEAKCKDPAMPYNGKLASFSCSGNLQASCCSGSGAGSSCAPYVVGKSNCCDGDCSPKCCPRT